MRYSIPAYAGYPYVLRTRDNSIYVSNFVPTCRDSFSTNVIEMAERAGFEPAVHLWGHTHDFQSCSFSRSDISPQNFLSVKRTITAIKLYSGGERGIRTPVGACGPQIDFESIPLRPLRYLSAFLSRRRSGCGCYPLFPKKSTDNFPALFL